MRFLLAICSILFVICQAQASGPWVGKFVAEHVVTASAPDNDFKMLKSLLGSAKQSIHTSVYELDNPFVGDIYEAALDRGVKVVLLFEGAPIPKVPQSELYIASRLAKKGAKVFFYDDPEGRNSRQFKYLHAKYTVVDGKRVLVGSANYNSSSHPVSGTQGNREWEVVLDDKKAADLFEAAFENDFKGQKEWVAYGASPKFKLKGPYEPDRKVKTGKYDLKLDPVEDHDVPVQTVFAPDNSIGTSATSQGPMMAVLRNTKRTVDIEQLNFETYWGEKPYHRERQESPMMKAVVELARAGKEIRILLNDDMVFHQPHEDLVGGFMNMDIVREITGQQNPQDPDSDKPARDNRATMEFLNQLAAKEHVKVAVRLLNFRNCGLTVLHNKGMVVDQDVTFVGSLNWGESAMKFNREAAVLLKSPTIARYYSKAFEYDWRCSAAPR